MVAFSGAVYTCRHGERIEVYCQPCEEARNLRKRIAELEAKVERMKDALTAISTALDAYGVDYCRGTARAALESET